MTVLACISHGRIGSHVWYWSGKVQQCTAEADNSRGTITDGKDFIADEEELYVASHGLYLQLSRATARGVLIFSVRGRFEHSRD